MNKNVLISSDEKFSIIVFLPNVQFIKNSWSTFNFINAFNFEFSVTILEFRIYFLVQ